MRRLSSRCRAFRVGQLEPAERGASLRHVPVGLRKQLAQRVPVGRRERNDQTPGAPFDRHVVPHEESAQHGGILLLFEPLEKPVLPADDRAIAHPEEHADRVVAVARVTHHVSVAGADDLYADRLVEPVEPAERVPEIPRALVVLAVARLEHGLTHLLTARPESCPRESGATSLTIRR